MAAIDSYLSQIKSAIYGEEVRDSIYYAISAINADVSTVISSAQSTIDEYVKNVEIYAYVDELPSTGDEQKIYLVQEDITYSDEWSSTYVQTSGNPVMRLPEYLYLDGQENDEECPNYLDDDYWTPYGTMDLTHDFGVIVHISEYDDTSVTISDPEYALLVVSIKVSVNAKSSTHNMFADIRSAMRFSGSSPSLASTFYLSKYLSQSLSIDWNNIRLWDTFINSSIPESLRNTIRYMHIGIKEYIYDTSSNAWVYTNLHESNDISISEMFTSTAPINRYSVLANVTGTGIASGLKLSSSNKVPYDWLVGVIRSTTPHDKNILSVIGGDDVTYTIDNPYVDIRVLQRNNIQSTSGTELTYFNCDDILHSASNPSLAQPLQVLSDQDFKGKLYVWNNQLQHYIAMKAEDTFTVDCNYNGTTSEYELSKTFAEIDAYFRPNGTINWKSEVKGCLTHPGPGRFGNLINWYFSSNFYYFKYEGTTASSTTETYKVFKLDSNDTLTEVTD